MFSESRHSDFQAIRYYDNRVLVVQKIGENSRLNINSKRLIMFPLQ